MSDWATLSPSPTKTNLEVAESAEVPASMGWQKPWCAFAVNRDAPFELPIGTFRNCGDGRRLPKSLLAYLTGACHGSHNMNWMACDVEFTDEFGEWWEHLIA